MRKIDSGNRVSVPNKLHKNMNGDYYAILDPAGCISICPESAVPEIVAAGFDIAIINIDQRKRIRFSEEMKKFASITQRILILGAGSFIEVWDPGKLKKTELI